MKFVNQSYELELQEIKRSRWVLLIGGLSYITWLPVFQRYFPDYNDSLAFRIFVGVSVLATAILTFLVDHKNKLKATRVATLFAIWLMTLSSVYFLYSNNGHRGVPSSIIVLMGSCLAVLPSRRSLFSYAGFCLATAHLPLVLQSAWQFPPGEFAFEVGALVLITTVMQLNKFRAIEGLSEAENLKTSVLANMQEAVLLYDSQFRVVSFNEAAAKMFDMGNEAVKSSEGVGAERWDLTQEDGSVLDTNNIPIVKALTTGLPVKSQKVGVKTARHEFRMVMISAQPMFKDHEEKPYACLLTVVDITEMHLAQRQLTNQQAKLVAAAKMSSLGEMAAGVAHEINNPLAIISGRVEQAQRMVQKKSINIEDLEKILSKVRETVFRIQKIVTGLRSFARDSEKDPFEVIAVTKIVEETLSLCRERLTKHDIEVKVQIDPQIELDCRPGQISQVLLNLLQNAQDAIVDLPEKWIEIKAELNASHLRLSIRDSGKGIPQAIKEKIMQPFFTTKEVGKGTGLGLSISSGILKDHHGSLTLNDQDPRTCFVLEFPIDHREGNKSAA